MRWVYFASAVLASMAFLSLTVLAAVRGRRDPLARNLALLCLDTFVYCTSETIGWLHANRFWDWLNNATASLVLPLFYHLVIAFVGRRKALRTITLIADAYFGALALLSLSPIVFPRADALSGGALWAEGMLAGMIFVIVHGVTLLARHLRGASPEETARARLLLGAALIASVANATDLVDIAGASWAPRLGMLGCAVMALLLAAAALRVGVFERLSFLSALNAVAIAFVVVVAEISVFRFVGDRIALVVVFTVLVSLGALLGMRFVLKDYTMTRERMLAHATLGRMAAQMAHDIKNPLASIRGAAQFLAQERALGHPLENHGEFFDLLVAQCDRLGRIVDQYHRIGRAEPILGPTDLNGAMLEAMKFLGQSATVETALDEKLPQCETDRDLLVIALENVLRNAHEAAMGRVIHVATGAMSRDWLYLSVRDEGPGMDARLRERALEGFFTTKSQGSGLGLTFVRRVVEAHGGKLLIESREGAGTTVRIELRASAA